MKINNIISWIAIIISVATFCFSWIRTEPFIFDSLGFLGWIVAVLALLVTILIGWQIYLALDMKRVVVQIDRKKMEMERNNQIAISLMNCSVYGGLFEMYSAKGSDPFMFINCGLLVLKHSKILGNEFLCEHNVKAMLEGVPDNLTLSKLAKSELIKLICSMPECDSVKGFFELRDIIFQCQTYGD